LLKASIEAAVEMKALRVSKCERVIVDTTVQEKAIAHPVDSRLLEVARGKASIAATHKGGLIVGARTFPGNPYGGHTLNEQLKQVGILLEDVGVKPKEVVVDLRFRGVEQDNPEVEIIHRGKVKHLSLRQRRWLKRHQAVEAVVGPDRLFCALCSGALSGEIPAKPGVG
jgi:hypothetical protein